MKVEITETKIHPESVEDLLPGTFIKMKGADGGIYYICRVGEKDHLMHSALNLKTNVCIPTKSFKHKRNSFDVLEQIKPLEFYLKR